MSIFEHQDYDQHEQLIYCSDPSVGLKAIIALHSTALGPAAGGCRMQPYASEADAVADVLRLSKGMSYKNALAGLPLGGGKCVIIADPASDNKQQLLRAFSRHVQSLNGRYWTAIDVGVGPQDADVLAEQCDFIFARASQYEDGFNPSYFTALGGYVGIIATAAQLWARENLVGLRVAIQGLGATGSELAKQLHESGAELVVADVNAAAVEAIVQQTGAKVASPDVIHAQDVDIFSPCAMGAVINDDTLTEIRARAVCGLANNQLAEQRHGAALHKKGITYVPDYVVNAGGMIGASSVIYEPTTRELSIQRIHKLQQSITEILSKAEAEDKPASEVADAIAVQRISEAQAT